jgi:hypothetical protein
MLANIRFCFLLTLLLALAFAAVVPGAAQIQGVPASVTSLGFGGHNNPTPGVRASVTSLGSNGYTGMPLVGNFGNCCANFFFPPGFSVFGPNPPLAPGRHHRRHHDADQTFGPIAEPVYIPYGVPYAADQDDDAEDYQDASDREPVGSRTGKRQVAAKGAPAPKPERDADRDSDYASGRDTAPAAEAPAEPVAVQPTTVLVFKDGHRSEVVNYAIVGDTLIDFAGGRARKILLVNLDLAATRKANDDQGVEFKVPIGSE